MSLRAGMPDLLTRHTCCRSILREDVAVLYTAVCELFEMYMLHTLRAFADMPIVSIVSPTESQVKPRRP
jgi:hypothetical protein